jgi:fructokinase
MFDVAALGELLIDFTPAGKSTAGNALFERNPGGGPPNLLTALARLGGKGAFIGKVGSRDQFGRYLQEVLTDNGIDAAGLRFSDEVNTTLAFVHLDDRGDRSFSFYRNPGADMMLREEEVDLGIIDAARIFHFSSLSLTAEPVRSTTKKILEYARKSGKIISYDPNWRPPLWASDAAAKEWMEYGLQYTDILKISETELEFLTGETELEPGSRIFYDRGIKLVIITLGPKGCYYRCGAGTGHLPTYNTKVVDTTGSGDAFLGGLLYHISRLEGGLEELTKEKIEAILDFSNAVGALCATKRGGVPAMPELREITDCMRNVPKLVIK